MNKTLLVVLAVGAFLFVAEGLQCYTCSVGILGKCIFGSQQTCSSSANSCYSAVAAFNLTGALSFSTSGCINSTSCVSSTGSVLGVGYTITQTCCSTNLCNGASTTQLSITAALSAALLATTWSYM